MIRNMMYMYIHVHLVCRIYAISVKLSPEKSSSGIKCLEANNFKIYCFQTLTGNKVHTYVTVSEYQWVYLLVHVL